MYTNTDKAIDCLAATMWIAMFILLMGIQRHYIQCVRLHLISESLWKYNEGTLYMGETT